MKKINKNVFSFLLSLLILALIFKMKKIKRKIVNCFKRNKPTIMSIIGVILIIIMLIICFSIQSRAKEKPEYSTCKFGYHMVKEVKDGDSIIACSEDACIEVRALCIDAPDRNTYNFSNDERILRQSKAMDVSFNETIELAEVSTKKAQDMLLNKCVKIVPISVDKYNRLVGYIEIEGKDYQLEMIKMNVAIPYCRYNCNKYSKIESYKKASKFKCIE